MAKSSLSFIFGIMRMTNRHFGFQEKRGRSYVERFVRVGVLSRFPLQTGPSKFGTTQNWIRIDPDTGLQYANARWYDGHTNRWMSPDPMGFAAGDSNLYRYVNNRPTVAVDPSGMQAPGGPNDSKEAVNCLMRALPYSKRLLV